MAFPSPHLYRQSAAELGIPENVVESALRRVEKTRKHGALPILSINHLAQLSGAPHILLRRVVQRAIDPYSEIPMRKSRGGIRPISSPDPWLMAVQRLVLRRALDSLRLHPSAFAYRRGRSIVGCASSHVGARYLIKCDLHNFFGEIREPRVYKVFRALGYSKLVAFELARLCTRGYIQRGPDPIMRMRYSAIPTYAVGDLGYLPQGAPTSGAIANAVATPLDHDLGDLSSSRYLVYTRYSDDLVFSGGDEFSRVRAPQIVREVERIAKRHGFALHRNKTRIVPPGARHIVLGLLIDRRRVRLLPEFRRRVEVHIRGVRKFGLVEHARWRGFDSVLGFVNHIEGCLSFAQDVDPEWTEESRAIWDEALAVHGFPRP